MKKEVALAEKECVCVCVCVNPHCAISYELTKSFKGKGWADS